ncbi:MAG TPA: sarcosine oxidase subunit gamma family protein [Solirubrobacteraceae bacterium]|nr:sarcosine oxidase subunit gamma family protein [Solirubrobacteraceae bacterium]
MSLAFLTPDVTASREVLARSPMERLAVDAGARLSRVEGWSMAKAYSEPSIEWERLTRTVAFADRSSLTKLELQAEPQELAWIVAPASDGGGLKLEPGMAEHVTGTWWCPVTPSRVLMLGESGQAPALRATLEQAAEEARGTVTVLDVTCGLAAMSLIGPGARELLARFCAIDVRPALAPPGAFRPGSVARTPGYVLVEAEDRLLVLVGWALGEYLWQVVADAAAQLGGGPVGAEALAHYRDRDDA